MIGELEFVNKGDADDLDIVDSKVDDGESALEMIYEEDTGETPELEMELSINSGSESNGELKPKNHKWWGHKKIKGIDTPAKEHREYLALLEDEEFLDLQRRAADSPPEEQLDILSVLSFYHKKTVIYLFLNLNTSTVCIIRSGKN